MTYSVPLKVKIRLTVYDRTRDRDEVDPRHQGGGVFFGEIPLMTDTVTFIINARSAHRLAAPP